MASRNRSRKPRIGDLTGAAQNPELYPIVELSDKDLDRVAELAKKRNQSYEEIDGYQNYSHDSEATHEIGLYGEIAVAKWYDAEVDDEIVRDGDGGYDIHVNRLRVDVKTVSGQYGYRNNREPLLKIHPKNREEARGVVDVYVLAELIDERHVRLIGRISAREVEDLTYREAGEQFRDEFGNPVKLPSANYVAHVTDLIPFFID